MAVQEPSTPTYSTDSGDERDAIVCYVFFVRTAYYPSPYGSDPQKRAIEFAKKIDDNLTTNTTDSPKTPKRTKSQKRNPIRTPTKFQSTFEPFVGGKPPGRKQKVSRKKFISSPHTSSPEISPSHSPTLKVSSRIERNKSSAKKSLFPECDLSQTPSPDSPTQFKLDNDSTTTTLPISKSYLCSQCQSVTNNPDCCRSDSTRSGSVHSSGESSKDGGRSRAASGCIQVSEADELGHSTSSSSSPGDEGGKRAPAQDSSTETQTCEKKSMAQISCPSPCKTEIVRTSSGNSQYYTRAFYCNTCFWRITSQRKQEKTPYAKTECPYCEEVTFHSLCANRFTCTICEFISADGNYTTSFIRRVRATQTQIKEFEKGYFAPPDGRFLDAKSYPECESCKFILFYPTECLVFFRKSDAQTKTSHKSDIRDLSQTYQKIGIENNSGYRIPYSSSSTTSSALSVSNQCIGNPDSTKDSKKDFGYGLPSGYSPSPSSASECSSDQDRDDFADYRIFPENNKESFNRGDTQRQESYSGLCSTDISRCAVGSSEWGNQENERNDSRRVGLYRENQSESRLQKICQKTTQKTISSSNISIPTRDSCLEFNNARKNTFQQSEISSQHVLESDKYRESGTPSTKQKIPETAEKNNRTESFDASGDSGEGSSRRTNIQRSSEQFEYRPSNTESNQQCDTEITSKYQNYRIQNAKETVPTSCVKFIVEHNLTTGSELKTEFENDYQFIDYIVGKTYVKMIRKELYQ